MSSSSDGLLQWADELRVADFAQPSPKKASSLTQLARQLFALGASPLRDSLPLSLVPHTRRARASRARSKGAREPAIRPDQRAGCGRV